MRAKITILICQDSDISVRIVLMYNTVEMNRNVSLSIV